MGAPIPACVLPPGRQHRGNPGLPWPTGLGRGTCRKPLSTENHVVNSAGRTAPGWPRQRELLEKEGVRFKANGCADIARFMWEEIL